LRPSRSLRFKENAVTASCSDMWVITSTYWCTLGYIRGLWLMVDWYSPKHQALPHCRKRRQCDRCFTIWYDTCLSDCERSS